MPRLLKDSNLLAEIELLIDQADKYLVFVSPYIKLHDRIKNLITTCTQRKPWVEIIVVFGKNEYQAERSLAKSDLDFLKNLPSVQIYYEPRLHAKFYGSEDGSIVSSMNLHQFSQDNNIEIGIRFDRALLGGGIESELQEYFETVVENSRLLFHREAIISTDFIGRPKDYSHSEVRVDETDNFFTSKTVMTPRPSHFRFQFKKKETDGGNGFCIRTGRAIPFNPAKPMSAEAYESWAKFKNPDYPEKYCHKTGKPSNGKTSMRRPVL